MTRPSDRHSVNGPTQLTKVPTTIAMFRMSAVMWNAHRVHYDYRYATEVEGHAGLLVPANLLSSYLCELVMGWCGARSRIVRIAFQNRSPVYDNEVLTVWGRQTSIESGDNGDLIELEIGIRNEAGAAPVTGTARIICPPTEKTG